MKSDRMLLTRFLYECRGDEWTPSPDLVRFRRGTMTLREKISFVFGILFP